MRRFVAFIIALIVAVPAQADSNRCARIVSLAPSITETLFALGLGARVVGVTNYCRFPKEVASVSKVGGLLDLNPELIFNLKPAVVFALAENESTVATLRRLNISVEILDHTTVSGIKRSIDLVGSVCGIEDNANRLLNDLKQREERLARQLSGVEHLKVLVSVGHTREGSRLSGVYVSGEDGFYTGILELLGASNVNSRKTIAVPTLSSEGIRALNPDAVIEIVEPQEPELPETFWGQFKTIKAVQRGRIIIVREDFASIPGPRYILLAELLAKRLFSDRPNDHS